MSVFTVPSSSYESYRNVDEPGDQSHAKSKAYKNFEIENPSK